jgi:hypothetical protein
LLLDAIIKLLLNRLVLQTGTSNGLIDLRSWMELCLGGKR